MYVMMFYLYVYRLFFFFFKQKTAYEMRISDWSSDVCSSDLRDLLLTPSLLLLVAVGQAIVIITRNVDLSVGSVVGLTAYLTGRLFVDIPGIPLIAVFFGGLILGALLGLINGALVAYARVPALVITLGTMYIYRGINVAWAGSDRTNASALPPDFRGARRRVGVGKRGSVVVDPGGVPMLKKK